MPVYAKQPIMPCAGCARLLRRAAWVSWCSSPGILLYIPAMYKAEVVKRKRALKELVIKLLALWWDAWAEQSDPHSCCYRRISRLVVVVLPAADWHQCLGLGNLPAGWSHPAAQGRVQTKKSKCMKPQCPLPSEELALHIGWTSAWLQPCGQVVTTCWTLMLNSASALWYVYKKTTWKHRSPMPRSLHSGGLWYMFFTKRNTLGDLRNGFLWFKSGHFSASLIGDEWTAFSLKQKPDVKDGLKHTRSWKIMWKYLWHAH